MHRRPHTRRRRIEIADAWSQQNIMSEQDSFWWATRMPRGPWLMVVGMHRSGTSAVTGGLGALGFGTPHPDDRMGWHESNPDHWESVSINRFNEGLLALQGGSWEAPPDLTANWENSTALHQVSDLSAVVTAAYRDPGPLVWKDPRVCLVLPYWRRVLPPPLAAVLVWRSPLAVARSLRRRDGMHLADGVALWERYNRGALEHLVGVDTYVCKYETVLDDPRGEFTRVSDWLSSLPQFSPHSSHWQPEDAIATIAGGADRTPEVDSDPDGELLLAQHRELITRLSALRGGHQPLGLTPLMNESSWTTALIAARRGSRTRELDRLETERSSLEARLNEKQLALEQLYGSTFWRISKPLRALASLIRG
jgi:hypothetical protein